jgi:acetyl-CoA acyltransferase
VYATPKALDLAGITMKDVGLMELNEAFAGQVLACLRAFESKTFAQQKLGRSEAVGAVSEEILNVNGGAIALGHPVGATGARIILTALKEFQERSNVQFAVATLCIGGGQGGAVVLERV